MKTRRLAKIRLRVEELEPRVVLSTSLNWAGYAVLPTTGTVSFVSSTWTVPTVTGSGTAYSSAWVGIDGYNSPSVEQVGTEADIINGKAQYSAWYEVYPAEPEIAITFPKINGKSVQLTPGDSVTASVTYSANAFKLSITDNTQSDTYSTTQAYPTAQRSSAELIVEAPSVNGRIATLANFGSVTFASASTTVNNSTVAIPGSSTLSNLTTDTINLATSAGATVATTTLPSSGTAVTVTYTGPTTTTPPLSPPPVAPPPPPPNHHHGWWQTNMPAISTPTITFLPVPGGSQSLPVVSVAAVAPPLGIPTIQPAPAAATFLVNTALPAASARVDITGASDFTAPDAAPPVAPVDVVPASGTDGQSGPTGDSTSDAPAVFDQPTAFDWRLPSAARFADEDWTGLPDEQPTLVTSEAPQPTLEPLAASAAVLLFLSGSWDFAPAETDADQRRLPRG